jgi:hypothetical protein
MIYMRMSEKDRIPGQAGGVAQRIRIPALSLAVPYSSNRITLLVFDQPQSGKCRVYEDRILVA